MRGPLSLLAVVGDVKPQTFRWACTEYYKSLAYRHDLKPRTQYRTRYDLEACVANRSGATLIASSLTFPCTEWGSLLLKPSETGRAKPLSANCRVRALRRFLLWLREHKHIAQNPASELRFLKNKT
jgi:site-specific recombinase XerC